MFCYVCYSMGTVFLWISFSLGGRAFECLARIPQGSARYSCLNVNNTEVPFSTRKSKGPVKLIKSVKIAHLFLQSVSNQFHIIILILPM